jgi:hypothetical protein
MLKEKLGIEPALTKGERGTFEVRVNGDVVAARKFWGFPSEQEIVGAVSKAIGRPQSR